MAIAWRDLIRTVAPTLATALSGGNPLAGIAIKTISAGLLGKPDGTEEDVISFMNGATPETLKNLKEIEADFKLNMKELGVKVYELDVQDRADARSKEERTGDLAPPILAAVFIVGYIIFLYIIITKGIPQATGSKEVVLILTGVMAGAITQILNYYFGSSKGSADKTKLLSRGK